MFTAVAHKNLTDAEKYFDEHLAQNDYYAAGEIRPGQWIGAGAKRLGLTVEVTRDQFHALCENQNPNDGERLTQRSQKEGQRRVFYDFTCSAPKSVSVLAVTLDDQRLIEAHEEAARLAFRELETFAATRIRKQGVENRFWPVESGSQFVAPVWSVHSDKRPCRNESRHTCPALAGLSSGVHVHRMSR